MKMRANICFQTCRDCPGFWILLIFINTVLVSLPCTLKNVCTAEKFQGPTLHNVYLHRILYLCKVTSFLLCTWLALLSQKMAWSLRKCYFLWREKVLIPTSFVTRLAEGASLKMKSERLINFDFDLTKISFLDALCDPCDLFLDPFLYLYPFLFPDPFLYPFPGPFLVLFPDPFLCLCPDLYLFLCSCLFHDLAHVYLCDLFLCYNLFLYDPFLYCDHDLCPVCGLFLCHGLSLYVPCLLNVLCDLSLSCILCLYHVCDLFLYDPDYVLGDLCDGLCVLFLYVLCVPCHVYALCYALDDLYGALGVLCHACDLCDHCGHA